MGEHMDITMDENRESLPVRWDRAIPAAIALTIVGTWVWGGLLILTGRMAWIIAIGIGAGIGWGVSLTAGQDNDAAKILAAGSTLMAVLIGQIWFLADLALKMAAEEGVAVEWMTFFGSLPDYFFGEGFTDTLFAVGAGLLGAIYAIQRSTRTTRS